MSNHHLSDDDLLRYLDGEVTTSERSVTAAHLLACGACKVSLEALQSQKVAFASLLAELEIPAISQNRIAASQAAIERAIAAKPAARHTRGRWLQAAAVGSLLITSALATSPVRAFIADLWDTISGAPATVANNDTTPERAPLTISDAAIGFIPVGETFLLEVASTQADGSLILSVVPGASVTARGVGGNEVVEVATAPSGLRIENSPTATGDYVVSLPESLSELRVRIGESPVLVFPIADLTGAWFRQIELTEEAPGPAAP